MRDVAFVVPRSRRERRVVRRTSMFASGWPLGIGATGRTHGRSDAGAAAAADAAAAALYLAAALLLVLAAPAPPLAPPLAASLASVGLSASTSGPSSIWRRRGNDKFTDGSRLFHHQERATAARGVDSWPHKNK